VNTKSPSDRTLAAGGPPTHLTPGTVGAPSRHPKMQNEPNFHRAQISNFRSPPIRRGVFRKTNPILIYQVSNHPPFRRNEPNSSPANSQKLLFTKRTQFTPGKQPIAKGQQLFCRNEPNLSLPQPGLRSICAKRTQFTPPHGHPPNGWQPFAQQRDGSPSPQKCKTNPICSHSHPAPHKKCKTNPISAETTNIHSTIYNIQSLGPIIAHFNPAPLLGEGVGLTCGTGFADLRINIENCLVGVRFLCKL